MATNPYLTPRERQILERVRIGIAGAGGLGSNVASHLVRAGIRHLVIADFDVVSPSNLNRQFFFHDQIGQRKVDALAANLRRIEPELDLVLHDVRLEMTNMRTLFAACDIVVEAFDNVASKVALLEALRDQTIVAASGLAGWGHSDEMRVRKVGAKLVLVGDCTSAISEGLAPQSPRVGIAAAMQANAVLALALGVDSL